MKRINSFITVSLLVLLAIRAIIGLVVDSTLFAQVSTDTSLLSMGVLAISAIYLVAFIGIFTKQSWGAILALLAAIADMIFAVINGNLLSGSAIGDALIIFLAYKEYKRTSS